MLNSLPELRQLATTVHPLTYLANPQASCRKRLSDDSLATSSNGALGILGDVCMADFVLADDKGRTRKRRPGALQLPKPSGRVGAAAAAADACPMNTVAVDATRQLCQCQQAVFERHMMCPLCCPLSGTYTACGSLS
jgi:hypothetical protein